MRASCPNICTWEKEGRRKREWERVNKEKENWRRQKTAEITWQHVEFRSRELGKMRDQILWAPWVKNASSVLVS